MITAALLHIDEVRVIPLPSHFSTSSGRLEAFSDGVFAVIITIMVLDLKMPAKPDLPSLWLTVPAFGAYVLSFIFVGLNWNNHHHMLRAVGAIDGRAMWLNLHYLFWLSLIPFSARWLGLNPNASLPGAFYATLILALLTSYLLLQRDLVALAGEESAFARAVRTGVKDKASLFILVVAIGTAFLSPWICDAMLALAALIWFTPDRRMEQVIAAHEAVVKDS